MKNKARAALIALAALLIALACELLVFNFKALNTRGRSWIPLPEPVREGNLVEDKEETFLFGSLNRELNWCHILVEVRDANGKLIGTNLRISISDEGRNELYEAGTVDYIPGHDKGSWFRLNSYGAVRDLSVTVSVSAKGGSCRLLTAEYGGSVPFRVSVPRIVGIAGLLFLLWLLRPGSPVHDNRFWNRRRALRTLCIFLVLLVNLGLITALSRTNAFFQNLPENRYLINHTQYPRLARALTEGETRIDTEAEAKTMKLLGELENPYDSAQRSQVYARPDTVFQWDIAFYEGHLYVYFGIVPVLLTYLPYYLLTGSDMPTWNAAIVSFWLIVLAAFLFVRAVIRRWFPRTPLSVWVMLSLLLGSCTGLLFYAMGPSFYVLPVSFSIAFVLLAMALWISAAERWERSLGPAPAPEDPETLCFPALAANPGGVGLRITLGALCAALVAGCRPQFLVFSALSLPIFWPLLRQERRRAVTLRRLAGFAIPYLVTAAGLMYYNQIRFGSPFDFGANYNLTTNAMPLRGFRRDRLPDGLFAYFLALPRFSLRFPYVLEVPADFTYMGLTIAEPMFGGVLLVFPFLWALLRTRRVWPVLREKRLRLLFLLPLALSLIVVLADTEMAGILWRYTGDFLLLLYLSAALIWLALLEQADAARRRRLLGILVAVCLLTLALCFLISVSDGILNIRTPENYYRLKDFLSF